MRDHPPVVPTMSTATAEGSYLCTSSPVFTAAKIADGAGPQTRGRLLFASRWRADLERSPLVQDPRGNEPQSGLQCSRGWLDRSGLGGNYDRPQTIPHACPKPQTGKGAISTLSSERSKILEPPRCTTILSHTHGDTRLPQGAAKPLSHQDLRRLIPASATRSDAS